VGRRGSEDDDGSRGRRSRARCSYCRGSDAVRHGSHGRGVLYTISEPSWFWCIALRLSCCCWRAGLVWRWRRDLGGGRTNKVGERHGIAGSRVRVDYLAVVKASSCTPEIEPVSARARTTAL